MKKSLLVLPLMLAVLGTGCWSSRTPSSITSPTSTPAVEPGVPAISRAPCGHYYFPMKRGSSITYKTTSGDHSSQYVMTVKSNEEGAAVLEYNFENGKSVLTQNIVCESDGTLAVKGYLDMSSAMAGARFKVETKSATGAFLPKDLAVGSIWSATFDMNVTPENNEMLKSLGIATINQQATITSRAVGEERVTVPAGTFDALKVETTTRIDATLSGSSPSNAITFTSTEWWVKEIGMVKTQSSGAGSTSLQEAVAITK